MPAQKPSDPRSKQRRGALGDRHEVEELAALLADEANAPLLRQILEDSRNPRLVRKRRRDELRGSAFGTFLGELEDIPAGSPLPEPMERRWRKWIRRFEEEEIAKLPPKDRTAARAAKRVKCVWVTAERNSSATLQTGRFVQHEAEPSTERRPIRVIVIYQQGSLRMPEEQLLAAKAHPFVRAFCQSLPPISDKEAILAKTQWALNLADAAAPSDWRLANAAAHLQEALYGVGHEGLPGEPVEPPAFNQMPDDAPIWKLLDAAIGFGRMLQEHEIFGDGAVERLLNHGIVQPLPSLQREKIGELMNLYREEKGDDATAEALLGWLGAKRPNSDLLPIRLPEKWIDCLGGLTWPAWNQHVKNLKRKK